MDEAALFALDSTASHHIKSKILQQWGVFFLLLLFKYVCVDFALNTA